MANFKTHLSAGVIASLPAIYAGEFAAALAVVAGSIAPDIDCDTCYPIRIFFGLAVVFLLVLAFRWYQPEKAVAVFFIGMTALAVVRVIFERATAHRGFFHTPAFALLFGALCAIPAHFYGADVAWVFAGGVAGVAVHFVADFVSTGWVWRK